MIGVLVAYGAGGFGDKHIVVEYKMPRVFHTQRPDVFKNALVEDRFKKRHEFVCVDAETF